MPSASESEADLLAEIEGDLSDLTGHVNVWISDRFLVTEDPVPLNLEDVSGLIVWLQQWHNHFATYGDAAATLAGDGHQAVAERLAQIRVEIDNSIASFTEMAATLLSQN
jgi:hypothetical protein